MNSPRRRLDHVPAALFRSPHDRSQLDMRRLAPSDRQGSLRFTAEAIDRGGCLPIAPDSNGDDHRRRRARRSRRAQDARCRCSR